MAVHRGPEPAAAQEPEDDAPPRSLREADRIRTADRLREKASVRTIAAGPGRSPSTISREIRRDRTVLPSGQWYYRPHAAHRRAIRRRPRPKVAKIGQNPEPRDRLDAGAAVLNSRPRTTLGRGTPAERLPELLATRRR
ncbi:helix-turn-helix domain-containing protein [Streptomyces yangpuensis]|uniref:helix-turn-helix domain-containing protein n=1 Tax=Streptomyces yangpuensis TaxID=1648182 RepID=UPI00380D571B